MTRLPVTQTTTRYSAGWGDDVINAKGGQDSIDGGSGADTIVAGTGYDDVLGGRDRDRLDLGDAGWDSAHCGSGADVVKADGPDETVDCEVIDWRPGPQFDRYPPETLTSDMTTIEFSQDGAQGFMCSLDGADFSPCSSPYLVTDLTDGGHVFSVYATSLAGELEQLPTAAVSSWFEVNTSESFVGFESLVRVIDGIVTFRAHALEQNNVSVTKAGDAYEFRQSGRRLRAGQGCSQIDDYNASCPGAAISSVEFFGYDGDDSLTAVVDVPVTAFGGDGNDTLAAGPGDDRLIGGAGEDLVSYAAASAGVEIDLGVLGEQITGSSGTDTFDGIEGVIGSDHDDVLTGNDVNNRIHGGSGDDTISAGSGSDIVFGGSGADVVTGAAGFDQVYGEAGNDQLSGGEDSDSRPREWR